MKTNGNLYEQMRVLKDNNKQEELIQLFIDSLFVITNSAYTLHYYQLVKDIEISKVSSYLGKLMIAWLAFLNGDNAYLFSVINQFDEDNLQNSEEKSLFYSLKSLMTFKSLPDKKLELAKLSVDVLPKDSKSLFMANAKLTYAQMLAGFHRYREAAKIFGESYEMFFSLRLEFPAAIALTNKMLNMYYLGELNKVIDECNATLVMSSNFQGEGEAYWGFLHLPLGMSYFQMNKINLACKHLETVKACIDETKLLHVFGVTEPFLLKSYYLLNDKLKMQAVNDSIIKNIGHMNYVYSDVFQCLYYLLSEDEAYSEKIKPIIERLDIEFNVKHNWEHYQLIEVLLLLKQKEISDIISTEQILELFKNLRFTGMLTQLQELLIFWAEINYKQQNQKEAEECLKEAVNIKNDTGIIVNFFMFPLKSVILLKKIDLDMYQMIENSMGAKEKASGETILSIKEKEILELVAVGKSNAKIGEELYLSIGTVKWYLNRIYSKLYVKNRTQAIAKAKSLGEIQ